MQGSSCVESAYDLECFQQTAPAHLAEPSAEINYYASRPPKHDVKKQTKIDIENGNKRAIFENHFRTHVGLENATFNDKSQS